MTRFLRRLLPIAAWFLAASIVYGLIAWTQINRAERNLRAQIASERARAGEVRR